MARSLYHCQYCNGKIPSKTCWIEIQITTEILIDRSLHYLQLFHKDLIRSFLVILLTDKQMDTGEDITALAEVMWIERLL